MVLGYRVRSRAGFVRRQLALDSAAPHPAALREATFSRLRRENGRAALLRGATPLSRRYRQKQFMFLRHGSKASLKRPWREL
jgi:hypothetical protein